MKLCRSLRSKTPSSSTSGPKRLPRLLLETFPDGQKATLAALLRQAGKSSTNNEAPDCSALASWLIVCCVLVTTSRLSSSTSAACGVHQPISRLTLIASFCQAPLIRDRALTADLGRSTCCCLASAANHAVTELLGLPFARLEVQCQGRWEGPSSAAHNHEPVSPSASAPNTRHEEGGGAGGCAASTAGGRCVSHAAHGHQRLSGFWQPDSRPGLSIRHEVAWPS